jgi:hypothetical protein
LNRSAALLAQADRRERPRRVRGPSPRAGGRLAGPFIPINILRLPWLAAENPGRHHAGQQKPHRGCQRWGFKSCFGLRFNLHHRRRPAYFRAEQAIRQKDLPLTVIGSTRWLIAFTGFNINTAADLSIDAVKNSTAGATVSGPGQSLI